MDGVLEIVVPPQAITEIWDGMFDWLDDYEQGWTFEKLYPSTEIPKLTIRLADPAKTPVSTDEKPF